MVYEPSPLTPLEHFSRGNLGALVADCMPGFGVPNDAPKLPSPQHDDTPSSTRRAVAISGTGNGDSFIRLAAARTAISKARFARAPLSEALPWMAGPGGELQKSAGDRWGRTHEGTGGMIGIEVTGEKGTVVYEYNCGGMMRAWIDDDGKQKCLIFRKDNYESE
jgi:L-asparaginase